METTAPTDVYYDPYDVGIVHDPYPVYARLVEEAPLYYNERYDFWALSRYADVDKALSNWETFSNSRSDILELVQSEFDMPPGVMMFEDPPLHTMLRGPWRGCSLQFSLSWLTSNVVSVFWSRSRTRRRAVRPRSMAWSEEAWGA